MFGASQGFASPAGAGPETKKARVEEKQTCVPVTARILQDAAAAGKESGEVLIHGSEATIVNLVGVVEALVEQTAMVEFQLNDASGRIVVRHYTSGGAPALEGLKAGSYVSIIGNLRTSPATHVSAMSLKAVTSADEVSYHMIEVAHATLKLCAPKAVSGFQSGGLSLATPTKRVEADSTISPMKVDAPPQVMAPDDHVMPAATQTQPVDLRSSVLAVLRQEKDKAGAEGIAMASILAKCQAPSSKVQEVMTQLVDEGEIFTTIDDAHFEVM